MLANELSRVWDSRVFTASHMLEPMVHDTRGRRDWSSPGVTDPEPHLRLKCIRVIEIVAQRKGATHTVQMPVLCLQCRVINTTWKSKDSSLEHHHQRSEISFQKPIIFCVNNSQNIMVCPSGD